MYLKYVFCVCMRTGKSSVGFAYSDINTFGNHAPWISLSITKPINFFSFWNRFLTCSHTHSSKGWVCWLNIQPGNRLVNDCVPGLQPTKGGAAQFQGQRRVQFWHADGGTCILCRSWISLSLHPWPCQRGCPKPKTCYFWWKSWVSIPKLGRLWKINLKYAKAM